MNGGNIMYECLGPGTLPSTKIYKITLLLYRDNNCSGCPDLPDFAQLYIIKNVNKFVFDKPYLPISSSETVSITQPPCLENGPSLSYTLNKYVYTIQLPNTSAGYNVVFQHCCRPELENVTPTISSSNSLTIYALIPPTNAQFLDTLMDNSPVFKTAVPVICANRKFSFDFSAIDPDGNPMRYEFATAYESNEKDTSEILPPFQPPAPTAGFKPVTYTSGFSATSPLGPLVSIDRDSGIISGIAPGPGKYLISVIVRTSYRPPLNDFTIAHRKDFVITVASCDLPGVFLKQGGYTNCNDFSVTFENLNNSPLNVTYDWNFGDPASGASNTSTITSPAHVFSASGDYTVKLVVNKGTPCADSAVTTAKVYPGFYPGFTDNTPQCANSPVQFTDTSRTDQGAINYWLWDFSEPSPIQATNNEKDPAHTYVNPGFYHVSMFVRSSKGCTSTIDKVIEIVDQPKLEIGNDTLICSVDILQMNAQVTGALSGGIITWTPNYNINDINSFTPLVNPAVNTTYYATYSNSLGCKVTDSIRVNVVNFVTLYAPADTSICSTDPVKLAIESDGLHYLWTPATDLNDPSLKNPIARPTQSRTYHVVASIGGCSSSADISIKAIDYPKANAGQDSAVCLGTSGYLHATGGAYYSWSPAVFLSATNIPDPVVVYPTAGVKYIVTVRDTLGCPKPARDTVLITVINIKADAGPRDTAIVIGQPLQLNATGAGNYSWTPNTWLDNATISNPVALPQADIEYRLKVTDATGCYGLDSIKITLYNLPPGLYTPNAFTPNGDGKNDLFKPIPLGMKSMVTFRIYNRSGQLIYSGTGTSQGWDGRLKGDSQGIGTFVWYAEGIDYLDKKIQRKGFVVLIR